MNHVKCDAESVKQTIKREDCKLASYMLWCTQPGLLAGGPVVAVLAWGLGDQRPPGQRQLSSMYGVQVL